MKSQVICNTKGLAVDIVTGISGSVHDMIIFHENYSDFKKRILDIHSHAGPKILADKGYQSHEYENILITPTKGNPMGLTPEKNEMNAKISSVRVLVENYFWRLKNKFEIMSSRFRNERESYKIFFKICCSLVNFDIKECGNVLRAEDGEHYIRLMTQQIYLEKKTIGKIKS